ncbi:hypothetical protein [Rhizobium laguerreae]
MILPITETFPLSETGGSDRSFCYAGRPGTVDLARAGKSRREGTSLIPDRACDRIRNLLLAVHDALGWLMTSKTAPSELSTFRSEAGIGGAVFRNHFGPRKGGSLFDVSRTGRGVAIMSQPCGDFSIG